MKYTKYSFLKALINTVNLHKHCIINEEDFSIIFKRQKLTRTLDKFYKLKCIKEGIITKAVIYQPMSKKEFIKEVIYMCIQNNNKKHIVKFY